MVLLTPRQGSAPPAGDKYSHPALKRRVRKVPKPSFCRRPLVLRSEMLLTGCQTRIAMVCGTGLIKGLQLEKPGNSIIRLQGANALCGEASPAHDFGRPKRDETLAGRRHFCRLPLWMGNT